MRKMMLVAAAVLAAAVTQAASVGWSLAGATNFKNDAYQFFLIGQNGVTGTDQIAAILDAGGDTSSYAFGSGTVNGSGAANVMPSASGKSVDAGTYTGFYVVFDAATAAAANNYALVSGASGLTKSVGATTANVTFASGSAASILDNPSNWHATPEPTGVALLLLGAAAFGLRRKRA